jgi:hypothetical protein
MHNAGIFYSHLVYYVCGHLVDIFPVLVCCAKKNQGFHIELSFKSILGPASGFFTLDNEPLGSGW